MKRTRAVESEDRDLGFGSLAGRAGQRLIQRDGSFSVVRTGRG